MTQAEVAAYVQEHLRERGIDAVLSGGAAVALFSTNAYVSADIDLVPMYAAPRKQIKAAMHEIGFTEKNRYFVHPDTQHIVEFPAGPLAIGDEPVASIRQVRLATGVLRVISPTDCVKDRLTAYYYWKDRQSLSQAVLVATSNRVNLNEIKRWSDSSGYGKDHEAFAESYAKAKRKR